LTHKTRRRNAGTGAALARQIGHRGGGIPCLEPPRTPLRRSARLGDRPGPPRVKKAAAERQIRRVAEWPYVADVRVTFYSLLLSGYARHTIGADNFGRYLNYTLINTLLYIFQSTCRSLRMRRENPSLGFREPRVQRALYPIRKGALQTARRGGRARSRGSAPHGSERWRPTKGMGA